MIVENIKKYQNRIVSASQGGLLVITYELFLEAINSSLIALENEKKDNFTQSMITAHKLHRELTDNLDLSYEISKELLSLYIYMNKKLIEASIGFKKEPLEEVYKVIEILLIGWREAEKEDRSVKPLIENAQQLYAGLTYGKGQLNEVIYQGIESRGLKA